MSPGRAWGMLVAALLLGAAPLARVSAQTPLRPPAPNVPAVSPGSELRIFVVTMGQGEALWERFGHNGIVIRDARAGTAEFWNWGLFDFAQPNFLSRFLTGDTKYWMAAEDLEGTLERYRFLNRTIELQELALTDAQKLTVRDYIRWNAQDDHKFYRYDYYLDNCSTRVRDVLNRALGGGVARALQAQTTTTSYRTETQRLLGGMPIAAFGVTLALGRDADRPLTAWESSFVPMRLRDALRSVQVAGPDGALRPLVLQERTLFRSANRAPELTAPPTGVLLAAGMVIGLVVAALLWLLAQAAPQAQGARIGLAVVASLWWLVIGVLGVVLFLAWAVTRHQFWAWNVNLLLVSPLALGAMIIAPVAMFTTHARSVSIGLVRGLAIMAVVATLWMLLPGVGQQSLPIALAVLPAQLVLAWAMPRVVRTR